MPHSSPDIVIDIETIPCLPEGWAEAMQEKLQPPSNYKDEDKIAAWREKKIAGMVDKAALSPRTGAIVCIGIGEHKPGYDWQFSCATTQHMSECEMLERVDHALEKSVYGHLVTFNGKAFDVPFLIGRSMKYNLILGAKWPLNSKHIDLFRELGREGGLGAWAMAILGEKKLSSGAEVQGMIERGAWDEVERYCVDDVKKTAAMFDRFERVAALTRR